MRASMKRGSALEDGLPQVAIYNLSQTPGKKFARGEQATAELLAGKSSLCGWPI